MGLTGASTAGKTTITGQLIERGFLHTGVLLDLWEVEYPPDHGIFHFWTEGQLPLVSRWYADQGVDRNRIAPFWSADRGRPITSVKVQDDIIRRMRARPGTVGHKAGPCKIAVLDNFTDMRNICFPGAQAADETPAFEILMAQRRILDEVEAWLFLNLIHVPLADQLRPRNSARFVEIIDQYYSLVIPEDSRGRRKNHETDRRFLTGKPRDTAVVDLWLSYDRKTRLYKVEGDWKDRPSGKSPSSEEATEASLDLRHTIGLLLIEHGHLKVKEVEDRVRAAVGRIGVEKVTAEITRMHREGLISQIPDPSYGGKGRRGKAWTLTAKGNRVFGSGANETGERNGEPNDLPRDDE